MCALATCFHKDAFMYVCMCGGEQGAFGGGLFEISSGICGV